MEKFPGILKKKLILRQFIKCQYQTKLSSNENSIQSIKIILKTYLPSSYTYMSDKFSKYLKQFCKIYNIQHALNMIEKWKK